MCAAFVAVVVIVASNTGRAQAPRLASPNTGNDWSLSPASTPPVTVADLIRMGAIGSLPRGSGVDDDDAVSPDGARHAVVIRRGNLERNTVDFTLLLFRTGDLLRPPTKPDTVATFASSSNRPGILHVRWLPDNVTLMFLAERPGELPQVYTLDTRTRRLTQRTHAKTAITAFDAASIGDPLVYAAEEPRDTLGYAAMRAHGFALAPHALVSDVIAGDWGLQSPAWYAREPSELYVVRGDTVTTAQVPDSAAGYLRCLLREYPTLSIAPSGDVALMECEPQPGAPEWAAYRQKGFRELTSRGFPTRMYVAVDLATGHVRPLINALVDFRTTLVWARDGRSVVLANTILPFAVSDSAERSARPAPRRVLAEVDVHTGAVTVIARRDSLRVLRWDPRTATVVLAPGEDAGVSETRRVYYRKTEQGWMRETARRMVIAPIPTLVVDQGLNTPARLVSVDPRSKTRRVVYDPNPGLLTKYRFGREDVVHWKTKDGITWAGGLYWPSDYVPGRRYPLLIQTHGFDSTTFSPDGVFATGEAAQPLANAGIIVLQAPIPPEKVWLTPQEGPLAVEAMEGAIEHLETQGLIDRTKVGMQGFSRSCYHTLYFLTHSQYPIAAATVTDGVDFSYLQYLIFAPTRLGLPGQGFKWDEAVNGGPPFGSGMAMWQGRSSGFNLDKVTAALQLTALQPFALLQEWEPYAGLLLQGKPVEMIYIPDGEHILTKPWEQMTSQQGAVDWFRFWLKGEEDPDPAKREQYARWHVLRAIRDSSAAKTTANTRP